MVYLYRDCQSSLIIYDRDLLHEIALPRRIFKSSLLLTRLSATVICFTRRSFPLHPSEHGGAVTAGVPMMQRPLASCNPPNSCYLTEASFKGRDRPPSLAVASFP